MLLKMRYLAAGSAMLVAGAAHAQSSVTLFGLIDTGVVYQNNARVTPSSATSPGGSSFSLQSGCFPFTDRSMIASRRCPNEHKPSDHMPESSGPRWDIASVIGPMISRSEDCETIPAIPHITGRFPRWKNSNYLELDTTEPPSEHELAVLRELVSR